LTLMGRGRSALEQIGDEFDNRELAA